MSTAPVPRTLIDMLRRRAADNGDVAGVHLSRRRRARRSTLDLRRARSRRARDRRHAPRPRRASGKPRPAPLSAGTRLHRRVLRLCLRRRRRRSVVSAASRAIRAHAAAPRRYCRRRTIERRAVDEQHRRECRRHGAVCADARPLSMDRHRRRCRTTRPTAGAIPTSLRTRSRFFSTRRDRRRPPRAS